MQIIQKKLKYVKLFINKKRKKKKRKKLLSNDYLQFTDIFNRDVL